MPFPAIRLLVLGVIRSHGSAHGYAVRQELDRWRAETWTSTKPGSLYNALHQLAKEGKLRPLDAEASRIGPGKVRYELTMAGELEFKTLLTEALGSFELEAIGAGMAFIQALTRERALAILRVQLSDLLEHRDRFERLQADYPERDESPHTQDLLALWGGSLGAIAAWTEGVLRRLEAGGYVMAEE